MVPRIHAKTASLILLLVLLAATARSQLQAGNSTYYNPMLPGFHPDPSCIFVPEWDDTYFCASSSFNAFPGIPIHASRDLRNWKLIVTTLVDDDLPADDDSRWDNVIFKATDPYDPLSWAEAVHFDFVGYDTSPFWDVDGKVYITGAHAWRVSPGILQAEANLDTGEVGEWKTIWNGTGGEAPEGPHIYLKDGYYYMMAAEGGTGLGHMVTMARSQDINGPYESSPANPVLTNANTTNYFQTLGHADLFKDSTGNWWCVALSTRSGPEYIHYPMGRETVLTPVTWEEGEYPTFSPVNGEMSGWPFPSVDMDINGPGPFTATPDTLNFSPNTTLPAHLTHWRFPLSESYAVSPPDRPNTLRLAPSRLNLTGLNGNYAGPGGQTFVGRRQQHTLFTYNVNLDFAPRALEEEAGVSLFLTQNHHLDLGVVMLPVNGRDGSSDVDDGGSELGPHFRFRGISYVAVAEPVVVPVPPQWRDRTLRLEIKASNMTHYAMSASPADALSEMRTIIVVSNEPVSWGFTGTILGIYCTSNGYEGDTPAYFSKWRYVPQGQFRN